MTCEEFRENVDAFALGALDGAEAAEMRAHLADCGPCAAEYRGAGAVASRLALGVPLVRAPHALRISVMSAIAREADRGDASGPPAPPYYRAPAREAPLEPTGHRDPRAAAGAAGSEPRLEPFTARALRRLPVHWAGLVAAVLALAALGLGIWAATLQHRVHDLEHSRDAARAVAAGLLPDGSKGDAQLTTLLSARDAVAARLQTEPGAGEATGAIVWSPEERRCGVVVRELAPLGPGWQYHAWFSTEGVKWDGGVLAPDATGTAQLVVDAARWHADYSYTVNIVAQPTSDAAAGRPVLSGTVNAAQ